jgi:hypothetical protein
MKTMTVHFVLARAPAVFGDGSELDFATAYLLELARKTPDIARESERLEPLGGLV